MFFRISVFRNRPSRLVASCTNLFCWQYTHIERFRMLETTAKEAVVLNTVNHVRMPLSR